MIQIRDLEGFEQMRMRSHAEPVVVFKHSMTCGVSGWARREVVPLARENVPVYEVVVQTARHVSNEIEARYGIRHESPQVIVLHRDRPTFNTSHGGIREDVVRQQLNRLETAEDPHR